MSAPQATIYPHDALEGRPDLDVISEQQAPTLDRLFQERVQRSGQRVAYTDYDFSLNQWCDFTWAEIAEEVKRWQAGFRASGLVKGDHVGIRLKNCRHWMVFDQAALGLGLVVVPLYVNDRPDNANYVLDHARVRLLLVGSVDEWRELEIAKGETPRLGTVVALDAGNAEASRVVSAERWLSAADQTGLRTPQKQTNNPEDLASIVYTSGTTGRPKGVMLSHRNLVSNAFAGLRSIALTPNDVLLSFLPLSHTLERTVGYYAPLMSGARVVFSRSIKDLADDLADIRPTGLISVPRIFERIYSDINERLEESGVLSRFLFHLATRIGWDRFEHRQNRGHWKPWFLVWPVLDLLVGRNVREGLGGNLRFVIVGGAPLPDAVSRLFIPLGVNLLQGYGLTESSPVLTTNTLAQNHPESIGLPLHGVKLKIGDNEELLAKGPNIMMGYWENEEATRKTLIDGWLATGDQARFEDGFVFLTGRIKDILVLANGEKIPPADMESAIAEDALFEQSMVIGEQMPYLSALVVLNDRLWKSVAAQYKIDETDVTAPHKAAVEKVLLDRIQKRTRKFPGYATIRRVTPILEPWTVENDLITPTLKLKRSNIRERFEAEIQSMYAGRDTFRNEWNLSQRSD